MVSINRLSHAEINFQAPPSRSRSHHAPDRMPVTKTNVEAVVIFFMAGTVGFPKVSGWVFSCPIRKKIQQTNKTVKLGIESLKDWISDLQVVQLSKKPSVVISDRGVLTLKDLYKGNIISQENPAWSIWEPLTYRCCALSLFFPADSDFGDTLSC